MRNVFAIGMLVVVFALMSGTLLAIGYCKDVTPANPPDKTFDEEWTMNVGEEIEFDIYLNDVPDWCQVNCKLVGKCCSFF